MTPTSQILLPLPRRFPAEWEPHRACLLLYPHNACTFRVERARAAFTEVARAIADEGKEDVVLFVHDQDQLPALNEQVSHSRIRFLHCPSNDTWARDTGATFVFVKKGSDKTLVGLDWGFNAYGLLYEPYDLDQGIPKTMCAELSQHGYIETANKTNGDDVPNTLTTVSITEKVPLVLEGGSIHSDGEGTLLTTAECLVHTSRNPSKSLEEIVAMVQQYTGCTKTIVLPDGLDGDQDTNGHVDNLACFIKPGHVLLSWTDNDRDDGENYQICRRAEKVLLDARDAQGRELTVHKLYLPKPMVSLIVVSSVPC